MDYLKKHAADLDKLTESLIIIELMHVDWAEVKRQAKARFKAGHDKFGTSLWKKGPEGIKAEGIQELADWLNYWWAGENRP